MAVTLKDIAQKAGTSVSTVSRIINNDPIKKASKETSDRVWQIVQELGYVPNQNARKLIKGEEEKKQRTKAIGCVFTSKESSYTDPFFSQIAQGIQDEILKRGYVMGYTFSSHEMTDAALFNNLTSHQVDGAIILGRFNLDTLKFLKKNMKHIIYAGINYVNAGFDEIICDGYQAAQTAVNYLITLGHTQIGYIGTVPQKDENTQLVNEHRYKGYEDTLHKHQLTLKEEWVWDTVLTTSHGYECAMAQFEKIKHRPTAFFCSNDAVAIGVVRAAHEKGIRIPEDLSVISIDDIEMASFIQPPLTTIHVPKEELGRFAVKTLIDRIEGQHEMPIRIDLPFRLIERKSCRVIK